MYPNYLLHIFGPSDPDDKGASHKLKSCYENCVRQILQNSIKSIAFCCIAPGIFDFDQIKAPLIASTTQEWFEVNYTSIDHIIFCFFNSPNSTKKLSDSDV